MGNFVPNYFPNDNGSMGLYKGEVDVKFTWLKPLLSEGGGMMNLSPLIGAPLPGEALKHGGVDS